MADSNFNNKNDRTSERKNDGSVFSWSNEFEAYSKQNNADKNQNRNQRNAAVGSNRFSNYNPKSAQTRRPPAPRNNEYRYEYPGEDYKYTPKSVYTEPQRRSDIYSNSFGINGRSEEPAQAFQTENKQPMPNKRQSKKDNRKISKEKADFSIKSRNPKKKKQEPTERKRAETQSPKNRNDGRAVQNGQSERMKSSSSKNNVREDLKQKRKQQIKEEKRNAKERIKLEKSNRRIKKLKASGLSSDEIRAILQQEKNRRRAVRSLFVVLLVIIGILIGFGVFATVQGLPIATIEVKGSKTYKQAEVIASGEISVGDNMLIITQKSLNEKISTALPYIESIQLKRELPDKLIITVKETKEKLLFETKKGFICTDKNFKIVSEKKQAVKNGKIKVVGFEPQEYELGRKFVPDEKNGNSQKFKTLTEILTALEETKISGCNYIDLTSPSLIELGCKNQMKIYVDSEVDYSYCFNMLAKQLAKSEFNPVGPHYYDLRFSGQIVYKEGELS